MSKVTVVTAAITSRPVRPGSRPIEVRKLTIARCGTATPFGVPVEPEVYSR